MLDVLEDPDDKKFGNASSVSSDNDSRANIARWALGHARPLVGVFQKSISTRLVNI